jgi:hypothetical protein
MKLDIIPLEKVVIDRKSICLGVSKSEVINLLELVQRDIIQGRKILISSQFLIARTNDKM